MGKPRMWFPNRSDTNRPVQAQKRARSLKFRILVEEELYYSSSENKVADQFRLCRLLVFSCTGLFISLPALILVLSQGIIIPHPPMASLIQGTNSGECYVWFCHQLMSQVEVIETFSKMLQEK